MVTPLAPFTTQHVREVREALRKIHEARGLIAKHRACGADCQMYDELADELEKALEGYRREFLEPLAQATE